MKFDIHFLPAKYGDAIWIEYGQVGAIKRILIDGGTGGTVKHIRNLIETTPDKEIELLVVTHIDNDHIHGALNLLKEKELDFKVCSVWFNGWQHLPKPLAIEDYGPRQGELISGAIEDHKLRWNHEFANGPVVVPSEGSLPTFVLGGGMKITLLSPTTENLATLRKEWEDELSKQGLIPGFGTEEEQEDNIEELGIDIPDIDDLVREVFHEDTAAANGSSIAFIAEYGGQSVLFAGDAFPSVVLASLNRLYTGQAPMSLVKLSHHASAHNTSPELIEKLSCKRFAVSTNGSIYKHPSQVTLARIIYAKGEGTELIFNYKSKYNECWDISSLKKDYKYITTYPEGEGISVMLL